MVDVGGRREKSYQSNKDNNTNGGDDNAASHLQPELPQSANLHPRNGAKVVLGDDGAHLLAAGTCKPFAPVTGGVALGRGHLSFLFAVFQLLSSLYNLCVISLAQRTKPATYYYISCCCTWVHYQRFSFM